MDILLIVMRFCHYMAVMSLCGAALFPFYALPKQAREREQGRQVMLFVQRVTFCCASIGFVSALGWLGCEAALMSGDPSGYRNSHTLLTVLNQTQFGQVWRWRLPVLAALALWSGWRLARRRTALAWPAAVTGVGLVASLASIGHGAMGVGADRWLHLGSQTLHLLAASVWVGGLPALLRCLRAAPPVADAMLALQRFSAVGFVAVLLIVASGSLNAWFLVGSLAALCHTPYGQMLLVKLAFFCAMVGLALGNRFYLVPRLPTGDTAKTRRLLLRAIMIEQACAALVVASVSVLGTLMPAFGADRMAM